MFKKILSHIKYWGEIYIALPLTLIFTYVAIIIIQFVNGAPIVGDSPDSVLGWLYNLIGSVLVMIITGLCQHTLFGYRSNRLDPKLSDDIYDAIVTMSLLLLFSHLLWK